MSNFIYKQSRQFLNAVVVTLTFLLVALLVAPLNVASAMAEFKLVHFYAIDAEKYANQNLPPVMDNQMYIHFVYEMYFEDVDRHTLFEFMREIDNDDLWCLCSETTLTKEGVGELQLGREWEQTYYLGDLVDQITYTRLWLEQDVNHTWKGEGIFANLVADYTYSDLPNGGVKLTFTALYRPNFPVEEYMIGGMLEGLRMMYEYQFVTYFGSTGHVDLSTLDYFYI